MAKDKLPTTQAVRMLKENGVNFTLRTYKYEEKGGTPASSRELGVAERQVIKTLVMEDEHKNPLLILLAEMSPNDLKKVLNPTPVNVAV
jgi:prolyl-tRNA editing enzyme YbaK/EbsC (Cys-tRNA(Pro) deacylase)